MEGNRIENIASLEKLGIMYVFIESGHVGSISSSSEAIALYAKQNGYEVVADEKGVPVAWKRKNSQSGEEVAHMGWADEIKIKGQE